MSNGVFLITFILVNVLSIASHVLVIKAATQKYLFVDFVVGDNVDHDEA